MNSINHIKKIINKKIKFHIKNLQLKKDNLKNNMKVKKINMKMIIQIIQRLTIKRIKSIIVNILKKRKNKLKVLKRTLKKLKMNCLKWKKNKKKIKKIVIKNIKNIKFNKLEILKKGLFLIKKN